MVSQAIRDEVARLRRTGLSYSEIQKTVRIGKNTVVRICGRVILTDEESELIAGRMILHATERIRGQRPIAAGGRHSAAQRKFENTCKRCSGVFVGFKNQEYCTKKCCQGACVSRRRSQMKRKAVEYMGGKCMNCGYNKSMRALQFHHRDGKKEFGISSGATRSWLRIANELKKCVLLCSNCHAEEHDLLECSAT